MKLIPIKPNPSGAYPPIQEVSFEAPPDGTAVWPDDLPTDIFVGQSGFVRLTVEDVDGVPTVTGCEPDEEARTAWEAAREIAPAVHTEQDDTAAMLIDHEYRLTLLELGLTGEGAD